MVETDPHTTNPDLADGGIDTVIITAISTVKFAPRGYTLGQFVDNVELRVAGRFDLTGNELANILSGNDEANWLDGQAGRDTLVGFGGNDTYILSSVTSSGLPVAVYDTVVERADGGIDTVIVQKASGLLTLSSYTLGANIERGVIAGTGAFSLSGNALDNTLTGNDANNTLRGFGGKDTLIAGSGVDTLDGGDDNDVLRGGSDADTFVFNGAWGIDRIGGFEDGTDLINLSSLRDENAGSAIARNQLLLTQDGGAVRIQLDLDRNGIADVIDLNEDGIVDRVRIDVQNATVSQFTGGTDFIF